MRNSGESSTGAVLGQTMSFYADGNIATAVNACIAKHFGASHGAKSRWFVEAAQRDLRARGMPDGSAQPSPREQLLRKLIEAAAGMSDDALQAKIEEIVGTALEAATSATS